MEGGFKCRSPRLLDLIPVEKEGGGREGKRRIGVGEGEEEEEQKLELRLWPTTAADGGSGEGDGREHPSVPSFGLANLSSGAKRGFLELHSSQGGDQDGFQKQHQKKGGFHHHCKAGGRVVEEQYHHHHLHSHEKNKAKLHEAATPASADTAGKASAVVHNNPQSRMTSAPVVGWPPVRSFRKNITSASKPPPPSQETKPKKPEKLESSIKGLFLKINMDGIPIGRKIDLKAHKSYESLSAAVDKLFGGLLAAQRETPFNGEGSAKESLPITGLLDGSGEYTLVYEDSDGDRILVGDVPWEMFVSTAKRLRVLKTSQLSTLHLGENKKASPASGAL